MSWNYSVNSLYSIRLTGQGDLPMIQTYKWTHTHTYVHTHTHPLLSQLSFNLNYQIPNKFNLVYYVIFEIVKVVFHQCILFIICFWLIIIIVKSIVDQW